MSSLQGRPPAPARKSCGQPGRAKFASGQLPVELEYYATIMMSTTSFNKKPLALESTEPAVTPPPPTGNTTFAKKPKLGDKSKKREIPEGLWTKCPKCSTMVFDKELDENLK